MRKKQQKYPDWKVLDEKQALERISGTSFKGYLYIAYQHLVDTFGEPLNFVVDKSDAEWVIDFSGEIATIYNYKDGKNYLGAAGKQVQDITTWHVGGNNPAVVRWLAQVLGCNYTPF